MLWRLSSARLVQSRGKVLVILSSAHVLDLRDGKAYHTGYYLDELAIPLSNLSDAGYTPVFADPSGEPTTFDPVSNDKMFFGGNDATRAQAINFLENLKALQKPKTLKAVLSAGTSDYVGIFIPGGPAPMQDLVAGKTPGQTFTAFPDPSKPTRFSFPVPTPSASPPSHPTPFPTARV